MNRRHLGHLGRIGGRSQKNRDSPSLTRLPRKREKGRSRRGTNGSRAGVCERARTWRRASAFLRHSVIGRARRINAPSSSVRLSRAVRGTVAKLAFCFIFGLFAFGHLPSSRLGISLRFRLPYFVRCSTLFFFHFIRSQFFNFLFNGENKLRGTMLLKNNSFDFCDIL